MWSQVLATTAATVAVVAVRRVFLVVSVRGGSMAPTLRDGDRLLVRRCRPTRIRPGTVVVTGSATGADGELRHRGRIVKRAVAVPGDPVPEDVRPVVDTEVVPAGAVVLRGDNEQSADSRVVGFYRIACVEGVLVCRL